MNAATDVLDTTRTMATELVARAERETGSRMTAYRRVAAGLGVSASWVRKFVAGDPATRVSLVAGINILNQYRRLCERIEAKAEQERARTHALLEEFDAATVRALDVVAMVQAPEARRADGAERGPRQGVTP